MLDILKCFRTGLVAPSRTTYDTICILLNTDDEKERDELTKRWRDHKLEELNFVGIVGALLAGCLTSTGSWPTILPNGQQAPWTVRACWYSGLLLALFAVLTAAQQALRLHRLSAHRDGLIRIRRCMAQRVDAYGNKRPRQMHVLAWQISVAFLTLSVACMIFGMCILAWMATSFGPGKDTRFGWWDDNSKMAVTFTLVLFCTLVAFFLTHAALAED